MPRPPQCMLAKKWAGRMPRSPQCMLAKIMGGQDATPSQCMLAERLQKIWTNKELFVYLFVMILAIFWLKRLSSWGVPNLPLTE